MLDRCKSHPDYKHLEICEEWQVFENFYADMGLRPDGKTLDRIDGSKGYSRENCRWATKREQTLNRKNTVWYDGQVASELAEKNGIHWSTFHKRLEAGWSIEDAINRPCRPYRRRSRQAS